MRNIPRQEPALPDHSLQHVPGRCRACCAQVLLRWGIQRGTSVIPKATKVSHLKRNLEAANWELPPEDFKLLNFLGYQARSSLPLTNTCFLGCQCAVGHLHTCALSSSILTSGAP